ncbi:MAG: hypothetical protein M1830_002904 [Pleopsidium flavum]|nr:MAG: hypothetical protein M1830_002904 [Pleopsidium flavum]
MASSTAPSTPDGTPPPILRRAFTVPAKLTKSVASKNYSQTAETAVVETLFTHQYGKIISFSPSSSSSRPSSGSGPPRVDSDGDSIGSLPWVSYTERTIAAGPLRFYRVPGMVAFLSSGSILRPILAKSQCWCVDGDTKFVLRISQNQYYRIELPNTSKEDKEKAGELKKVLAKVLQYETTPCPFQRSFTIQLPEPPKTPVRKRPWRPPARATHSEIEATTELGQESADEYTTAASDNGSFSSTDDEVETVGVDDQDTSGWVAATDRVSMNNFASSIRPKTLTTGRAITAPVQLTIKNNPPSGFRSPLSATTKKSAGSSSLSSSIDSFQSFHSPISPLPPSPPYSDPPSPPSNLSGRIDLPRRRPHTRDISEITVTAASPDFGNPIQTPTRSKIRQNPASLLETPTTVHGTDGQNDEVWFEMMEPSAATELRSRPAPFSQRPHSPLPLPANLYSPTSRASGHHLTTAILQKTCSVLLGPPVHLIALMLNIAKKIASGATRGVAFGFGEAGERIPCQWDYSDTDELGEGEWGEDDYGIALSNMPAKPMRRAPVGGSWEID